MFYKFLHLLFNIILFPFIRMRIENEGNIPKDRNYIVVANHLSNYDPLLLALVWKKQLHFMAKEELFKVIVIGKALKFLDMIPVRRGESDRRAVKKCLEYLANGEVLALFPEGTRNKKQEGLLPFHTGAAFFAKSTNLEVLPVAIIGTSKIRIGFFNKVVFKVGKPMKIDDHFNGKISSKELEEFTKLIRNEIETLLSINNENN